MTNKYYQVTVRGYGGELVLGTLTEAQFKYWEDREDEISEHVWCYDEEEFDGPEEAVIGEWYENDDIDHIFSCGTHGAYVTVAEVNVDEDDPVSYDAEIVNKFYDGNMDTLLEEHGVELKEEDFFSEDPGYYFKGLSIEKGAFWDGLIAMPDTVEFKLENLVIELTDYEDEPMITDIFYKDGEETYHLENDCEGDTNGKGTDFRIWEIA